MVVEGVPDLLTHRRVKVASTTSAWRCRNDNEFDHDSRLLPKQQDISVS
jgi:hypothetical protein